MINILIQYPILLLFVVASLGYLLGNIKLGGSSLGVAAVLFTGLFFGALDPNLQIPEILFFLGLSIFVYSLGLTSGPVFFNSFTKRGGKDFLFIFSMLLFTGLIAVGLFFLFDFSAATIVGIYSGSTTNTAALASVIDVINNNQQISNPQIFSQQAVVGYTFSYPMGVLGSMIAIVVMEKLMKVDYEKEKEKLRNTYPLDERLTSATISITNPNIGSDQLRDLFKKHSWKVTFGRIIQKGEQNLANWDVILQKGDLVMVVGPTIEIDRVASVLGEKAPSTLDYDRTLYDVQMIFLSNPKLAGRTLVSLGITKKFNAIVTRIRRGDIEILARDHTVLELGDRIRFIARREDLSGLSKYFGDSYKESSRVNLFSFGLGIGLGLIIGSIQFDFGYGFNFKLGYAGGPLIVGLLLGAIRRTGPVVWTLPYSATVTLQQLGLIFLLATIGVRSGNAFVESLSLDGIVYFVAGTIISLTTAITILWFGHKVLKKPFSLLLGIVSNQPAILDFAMNRTKNRVPEFGFTMMFPLALITKILIAQILFLALF